MKPTHPETLQALAEHSVALIAANQAASGAYVASPTFPVYRYSWLRDGAFIADAMSRAGRIESAEAFFAWCDRVLVARRDRIERLVARQGARDAIDNAEFLPTRYTVDGAEGAEDWTNFQLDGYGAWVWALIEHGQRHDKPLPPFDGAVLSARYVAAFWERPCYDWWEEFAEHRHPSTLAAIFGGLKALASWPEIAGPLRDELAKTAERIRTTITDASRPPGHVAKWLGGTAVDASLIAMATPFDLLAVDSPLMGTTVAAVERDLVHDSGVHRYADDTYYGGGEWLLLAGLLGWHQARAGRTKEARLELEWIAAQATPSGDLPEQVSDHLLAPQARDAWIGRWGPVASPLLWSHAMYLTLAIELGVFRP